MFYSKWRFVFDFPSILLPRFFSVPPFVYHYFSIFQYLSLPSFAFLFIFLSIHSFIAYNFPLHSLSRTYSARNFLHFSFIYFKILSVFLYLVFSRLFVFIYWFSFSSQSAINPLFIILFFHLLFNLLFRFPFIYSIFSHF